MLLHQVYTGSKHGSTRVEDTSKIKIGHLVAVYCDNYTGEPGDMLIRSEGDLDEEHVQFCMEDVDDTRSIQSQKNDSDGVIGLHSPLSYSLTFN